MWGVRRSRGSRMTWQSLLVPNLISLSWLFRNEEGFFFGRGVRDCSRCQAAGKHSFSLPQDAKLQRCCLKLNTFTENIVIVIVIAIVIIVSSPSPNPAQHLSSLAEPFTPQNTTGTPSTFPVLLGQVCPCPCLCSTRITAFGCAWQQLDPLVPIQRWFKSTKRLSPTALGADFAQNGSNVLPTCRYKT